MPAGPQRRTGPPRRERRQEDGVGWPRPSCRGSAASFHSEAEELARHDPKPVDDEARGEGSERGQEPGDGAHASRDADERPAPRTAGAAMVPQHRQRQVQRRHERDRPCRRRRSERRRHATRKPATVAAITVRTRAEYSGRCKRCSEDGRRSRRVRGMRFQSWGRARIAADFAPRQPVARGQGIWRSRRPGARKVLHGSGGSDRADVRTGENLFTALTPPFRLRSRRCTAGVRRREARPRRSNLRAAWTCRWRGSRPPFARCSPHRRRHRLVVPPRFASATICRTSASSLVAS